MLAFSFVTTCLPRVYGYFRGRAHYRPRPSLLTNSSPASRRLFRLIFINERASERARPLFRPRLRFSRAEITYEERRINLDVRARFGRRFRTFVLGENREHDAPRGRYGKQWRAAKIGSRLSFRMCAGDAMAKFMQRRWDVHEDKRRGGGGGGRGEGDAQLTNYSLLD